MGAVCISMTKVEFELKSTLRNIMYDASSPAQVLAPRNPATPAAYVAGGSRRILYPARPRDRRITTGDDRYRGCDSFR